MEEGRDQKELFEYEEPKRPFSKLASMLPRPDFEGRVAVTLTLEKMVFISIGIIMLMVLVFALGVERGKAAGIVKRQPVAQKAAPAIRQAAPIAAMRPSVPAQKSFFNTAPAVPNFAATAHRTAPAAPERSTPYTIVAATFSKKETAQAAVAFLNKEGLSGFVAYSDPYYRACVGTYTDMSGIQVQKDLAKVKRIYKGAYIRLR